MLWGIVELTVSAVGAYNVVKGAYNMYRDAEEIKKQYKTHQEKTEQYRKTLKINPLTESQYHRHEGEFLVLNRSQIIDPYTR